MARYRAILIDADDTLFDFAAAENAAVDLFLDDIALQGDAVRGAYRRINEACWRDLECGRVTPGELRVRRFRELLSQFGHPMPPEEAARIYESRLAAQAFLLPGALDAVRAVAEKLPVAIVTNGIARVQHGRLEASPLRAYVSALTISEEVGVAKPDPGMIYAALSALGMPEERRVLMVGDSLASDMRAAARVGVDACWVNAEKKARPMDLPVAHEIASIAELPPVALMA
jgi:YjjG family noncanonical pyrimidine nucleotidase